MKRLILTALVLGLITFSSEELRAQKGKGNNNVVPTTPDDYKALARVKEVTGKVVSADKGTLILRLDFPAPPGAVANPNPGKTQNPQNQAQQKILQAQNKLNQDLMKLQQDKARLATANPKQKQQQMQKIRQDEMKIQQDLAQLKQAQNQASGKQTNPNTPPPQNQNVIHKDFELELPDNVVLRKKELGIEYDNATGEVKKYTDAEKAKLRGNDPSKPGYQAKADELGAGQLVTVRLIPVAAAKKPDDDAPKMNRPSVSMVYMLTEATPMSAIPANPKKNKK